MAPSKPLDRFEGLGKQPFYRIQLAVLLAAMASFVPPASRGNPPPEAKAPCKCAINKVHNGWCEACKKGYVAGILVPSAALFEALDAHGHDFDPASIKCKTCQNAIKTHGFCDRDNMGFIHNLAYVSRLTYHLAKGTPLDASKLKCNACRQYARKHGWCEACKRGMAGNVAFTNRDDFEQAARQIDFLLSCIQMIDRCEICAVARFTGGKCPKCNILYDHDEHSTATAREPAPNSLPDASRRPAPPRRFGGEAEDHRP